MKSILFLLCNCFIFLSGSSYSQSKESSHDLEAGFTSTVVVNFKKESDKKYFRSLKLFNPLHIEPYIISPPPHTVDTSNILRNTYKIALSQPSFLFIQHTLFYIEPKDSLNFNFETLVFTKTDYKDTISINHGNSFFLDERFDKPLGKFNLDIYNKIINIKSVDRINSYLSETNINKLIDEYAKLIYTAHPNLSRTKTTFDNVQNRSFNNAYHRILFRLQRQFNLIKDESLKNAYKEISLRMLDYACKNDSKDYNYNLEKYVALYTFLKETGTGTNDILKKFNNCGDTVQQYIQLNLLRDGLIEDSTDIAQVVEKLTYPPFKQFAIEVLKNTNRGVQKIGYISNAIRSAEVYDTKDRKCTLGEVFQNSSQPYLLFDFCGTWCKPCVEEISKYSKTKHLDNSKKVKPIWLFFENDKSKWINIIEKYQLKKDNCFIIIGDPSKELIKELSIFAGWKGEFPHYFLFAKDGKIINKAEVGLSKFSESSLPKASGSGVPLPLPR